MKAREFKWLQTHCSFDECTYDGQNIILITPKKEKDRQPVYDILYRQQWRNGYPTLEEFNDAVTQLQPEYQNMRKAEQLRSEEAAQTLRNTDSRILAALPDEQKIKLLDHLLLEVYHSQDWDNAKLNHRHIRENSEKLQSLLFHLKLPPEFMAEEAYKTRQFCNRLKFIPNLKQDLENWQGLPDDKRQEVMLKTADIFARTYDLPELKLNFFTDQEYKEQNSYEDWSNPDLLPPTGYAISPVISVNTDRIRICDNYLPVNMIFHEALHITQQEQDFSRFPMMEKFFEAKFSHLGIDSSISDVYLMNPVERHAYGMESAVKQYLQDELKVKYVGNTYSASKNRIIQSVTEKARILSAYQNRTY